MEQGHPLVDSAVGGVSKEMIILAFLDLAQHCQQFSDFQPALLYFRLVPAQQESEFSFKLQQVSQSRTWVSVLDIA